MEKKDDDPKQNTKRNPNWTNSYMLVAKFLNI